MGITRPQFQLAHGWPAGRLFVVLVGMPFNGVHRANEDDIAGILIAEDDENDVYLIKRAFQKAHFENPLKIVRDGEEAIAYCEKFPIDDMPEDAQRLLQLLYSLVMVSFPVEVWRQPHVPDAGASALDLVIEPGP